MSDLTLPRLARKKRANLAAEATIPCATARTPQATHLTGDRWREPSFDDLIAGNGREPSHEDLLAVDEDDEDLKPTARELPLAYPGVSVEALAWLREQEQPYVPNVRDEHAFDVNRLVPGKSLRRTINLAQLDTRKAPADTPAANPRPLSDAVDALDRLPALYAVDAASSEMAASIAAIQTYTALRPELLGRHEMHMHLAPLAAQLAEPDAEPSNHIGQLTAAWTSIREAHTRFASDDFGPDRRFTVALKLDAIDEAIGNLTDELGDVRGVFDAEADEIELIALAAGLPMRQDDDEESLADWELELLVLPEGEPDPGAERAFADMDATADAVDAWYADQATASFAPGLRVVDNMTGAAGMVVKITLGRALVRLDRAPEGLTPISFFSLSPEAEPVQFVEDAADAETEAEIRDLMDLDGADRDESHFSRAQMDGEACTVCGREFAVGEPTVPAAYDLVVGQLFAHAACIESEA